MPKTRARFELPHRRLVVGLTAFSAVSAIGGGTEMLAFPRGNAFLPVELLAPTVFTTFVAPGLLLALVIGGASLVAAIAAGIRSRAAIDATLVAGGALLVWIVAEIGLLRGVHWLHALYGGLGLAILWLGVLAAWRSGAPRYRWVAAVTLAELIGFCVPVVTGAMAYRAGLHGWGMVAVLVGAGVLEGLALGAGQAWVMPAPVRRIRYAGLSAVAAGLVWGLVLSTMQLGAQGTGAALIVGASVMTGIVGLAAIGTAQWLELRHHVTDAHRWIAWTALAWALALPVSFAPGPLIDETTPLVTQIVLFLCAGLVMAWVMAEVTWQGAKRLT